MARVKNAVNALKKRPIDQARAVALKHGLSFKAESMVHGNSEYLDGKDPDGHVIQVAVIQK